MPRGKRLLALGIGTAVTAMLLTGCASPTPAATSRAPSPVATPTPAFTSDADAVAAARAFYLKYLAVSNSILESSDKGAGGLRSYLSVTEYTSEASDISALREKKEHYSGPVALYKFVNQSVQPAVGTVTAYVCVDVRDARLLNADGKDVTSKARGEGITLLVNFRDLASSPRIESSELWSGRSAC